MKKQILAFASTLLLSSHAFALDLGAFLSDSHDSHANYNYAEGSLLLQPDDFKGFELRGSYVFRPNAAIVGVFNRVSADVLNVDVTGSQFGIGARYFFALQNLEKTDLDLSAVFINNRVEAGRLSDTDTGLILGAQVRHMLSRSIGTSNLLLEEVYGGASLGLSSGDNSASIHAGFLVALNQQFSARAELLVDDGTFVSLGVRMKLGQPQRDPGEPSSSALQRQQPIQPAMQPVITNEASVITPSKAPRELKADPFALSAEEMSDLIELD